MAKLIGIISSGSGKVGNLVLTKGKAGRVVARAYQPQVNNPNTARQQAARQHFAAAVEAARPFGIARKLFDIPFGKLVANMRSVVSVSDGQPDYSRIIKIQMSDGAGVQVMPILFFPRARMDGDLVVSLTWDAADKPTIQQVQTYMSDPTNDKIMVVAWAYQTNTRQVVYAFGEYGAGALDIKVPASWSGAQVAVWACLRIAPATATTIPTETYPWKYPAPTSWAGCIATGNVE